MNRAIELCLASILIYTPLALGGARLAAVTPVFVVALLMFSHFLYRWHTQEEPAAFRYTILAPSFAVILALAVYSCYASCCRHASLLELYRVLTYGIVFYVIVNGLGSRQEVSRIVWTVIGMGGVLSFVGLVLYLGHAFYGFWLPGESVSATYMNRDHFAGYLEMAIPLAAGFLATDISRAKKMLVAFLIVLMGVAFVMAASRGAWVSLVFASGILLPFVTRRKLLKTVILAAIIIGIALYYALSHFDLGFASARARTIIEGAGVDEPRILMWMGAIDLIGMRPFLGWGLGTFVYAFPQCRPYGLYQYWLIDYAHNDYLQTAAEIGLAGLAAFLWVIVAAVGVGIGQFLRTGSPFKRGVSLGATVGVMSMSLHSFVDFNLHIPANAILFVTLIGIIMTMHRRRYD